MSTTLAGRPHVAVEHHERLVHHVDRCRLWPTRSTTRMSSSCVRLVGEMCDFLTELLASAYGSF